jgi:hypothetical protein
VKTNNPSDVSGLSSCSSRLLDIEARKAARPLEISDDNGFDIDRVSDKRAERTGLIEETGVAVALQVLLSGSRPGRSRTKSVRIVHDGARQQLAPSEVSPPIVVVAES